MKFSARPQTRFLLPHGLKKMDHRQLFNQGSALYASVRPSYPQNLFDYLAASCQQHQAAWDCACGNGQAAIGLADYFDTVYATDISQQQIANAKKHPKVIYSVLPSEHTLFRDDQFGLRQFLLFRES